MIKHNKIAVQFALNLIPLLGVIFFNWSIFALIYAYWLETLVISVLRAVMILTAQNSPEKPPHIRKALVSLIANVGVLVFYMIFIIVFIGVQISSKQQGQPFYMYLALIDNGFKIGIFIMVSVKIAELILGYFRTGNYKNASPGDLSVFFDTRTIMLHLVIVLGFFAFDFTTQRFNVQGGVIAFAAVFVIIKTLVDLLSIYVFPGGKITSDTNQTEQ